MSKIIDNPPATRRFDLFNLNGAPVAAGVSGLDDRLCDCEAGTEEASRAHSAFNATGKPPQAAPGFPDVGDISLRHPHHLRVGESTTDGIHVFTRRA